MDLETCSCINKLPEHVWELLILPRLKVKDVVQFSAVCRSWRSIVTKNRRDLLMAMQLPWLMLSRDEATQTGTFFCLYEAKTYQLKLTLMASKPESYCCGSSQGYLILANSNFNFIFNPFSETHILLPKQATSKNPYYFRRAILSTDDNSQLALAALGSDRCVIETCRPRDPEWCVFYAEKEDEEYDSDGFITIIETFYSDSEYDRDEEEAALLEQQNRDKENRGLFADILFYKGMLYCLNLANGVVIFKLDSHHREPLVHNILNVMPIDTPYHFSCYANASYLVESCQGELLMVCRVCELCGDEFKSEYFTSELLVYELREESSPVVYRWVQLQSLGDQMLFLGRNSSLCISAKNIPGFQGNCIYFTDDLWNWYRYKNSDRIKISDNGVFYLEDGRFDSFLPADVLCQYSDKYESSYDGVSRYSMKLEPVWIVPSSNNK